MAEPTPADRALVWARRRRARVRGINPWELAARVGRSAVEDRVAGLAAEMAFFALLSLVPLTVAFGAVLGYLEYVLGPETVRTAEENIIDGLTVVFSPQAAAEFVEPFVRGLLDSQRGGLALGGLLVTLYLASRVFTATIRALDLAYNVEERRGLVSQRLLAIGLAVAAVIVVPLTAGMLVIGPLLGVGRALADWLGLGALFTLLWAVGRWPLLVAVAVSFFALVYRVSPNVRNTWRGSLPGALLGVSLWMLATLGLRLYLAAGFGPTEDVTFQDEVLQTVGRAIGALVAVILWTYLTGIALLLGGELNAELAAMRGELAARNGGRRPSTATVRPGDGG